MNSRWGDEEDLELSKRERISVGFMWNFISMSHMITRIDQEVGEKDQEYPRSELMKIWLSAVVIIFFLALISYSVLMIATLPFLFFYGLLFFKISGVLKRFGYPIAGYWIMTVLVLVAEVALGVLIKGMVLS